jgi:phenylacetate-CoA ligase
LVASLWTLVRVLRERAVQERSCRWTQQQLQLHQAKSLAALRQVVQLRSPFYREFHRGLEHRPLEALPILTKALLMERFDDLVTDRHVRLADAEAYLKAGGEGLFLDRYVVLATSGSTGLRGVFLFDSREWIRAIAAITRPIAWASAARNSRRPPRAALIAAGGSWHYSSRVGAALANRVAPALRLDAATPIPELVSRLNSWRPEALATYPSVLRQLAAEQLAGRLSIPLTNVATSAEVLTADVRALVRRAWSIPVQNTYGATEYAPIASECPEGNLHLFEDGAIIEVVDDRGQAVPDGERGARLLLTVFGRYTQPLIRYELSDLVSASDAACPCGRPYRIVSAIDGREEDILEFTGANGQPVAVHPNQFHEVLEHAAVEAWQIEHTSSALLVRLVGASPEATAAVDGGLRGRLHALGVDVPTIEIRNEARVERGASGKAPLIISRVARRQSP